MYKSKNYYTLMKSDGIWEYYCYDEKGRRVHRSTGRKKRAEALEVIEERIAEDELVYPAGYKRRKNSRVPSPLNKASLMKDFCADLFVYDKCPIVKDTHKRGRSLSKSTCYYRRTLITHSILPYLGEYRVSELSAKIIDRWLLDLPDKNHVSNTSANVAFDVLKIILDYAIRIELIESNPCDKVKRLGAKPKEKAVFTDDDINKLFALEWKNKAVRTMCYLSANTGMRIGEIRALQGYQIHKDYILVDASISACFDRKSTKSGKPRIIPISEKIYNELCFFIREEDDYLFTYGGEKAISYSSVTDTLKEMLIKAELDSKGFTFHSFRHYFNTKLIASGVQAEKVRAVIGHSSEVMTEHYLHLSSEDMKEITDIQK